MKKNIIIRQENKKDHNAVLNLIESAFKDMEHTDHQEQFLVQRLRKSTSFIPELSLVAEHNNKIVGHILLTKIKIRNGQAEFLSLALAPVTVLPECQNQGIGGSLIDKAHHVAKALGFGSVILLGHADYYPRFGYRKASDFGIQLPFDVPDENCMAIELAEDGLRGINGTVEYPKEFFVKD